MCCTCGYAIPPNIAGRPLACSVIVAWSPSSVSINVPDAVEWLSGASVASYDCVAATAGDAVSSAPPNATEPAASTASTDCLILIRCPLLRDRSTELRGDDERSVHVVDVAVERVGPRLRRRRERRGLPAEDVSGVERRVVGGERVRLAARVLDRHRRAGLDGDRLAER